ncbi:hypothetical protein GYMLUDRAFT_263702 [Collybiopsis luxurians FD-317 M1]|uniref:AB hydrolase-1 domain-containing protein n=1 Tax=Collybiopsis luxurians FD-317 M1 TaxID=944289 RepID=A0A0D0CEF1_9AGAR|nr:hypothetical protein GYMLUDRAFT_263702 [Collybiopsis luxurians FD-317 M1]
MASNLKDIPLPSNITSNTIQVNDLNVHYLHSSPSTLDPHAPLVLLLHGFPELAYSWRKIMGPLSEAGYNVVAPDQRGYGRTTMLGLSGPINYDGDLAPFRMFSLVTDIVMLVSALGFRSVAAVVGHDFGSIVAGYCALIRPDLFRSVVMMSAPFPGAPPFPNETVGPSAALIAKQLAELNPPRKHYTMYFSSPSANHDMLQVPEGLHSFLINHFYSKSADWPGNSHPLPPHPLPSASASDLATLPHYYIMPLDETMPMAVKNAAKEGTRSLQEWLSNEDLRFFVSEFSRTGFQGGLNWYRCMTEAKWTLNDMRIFTGKRITIPAMFLAGAMDWGVYQSPGVLNGMKERVCEKMDEGNVVLVPDAGHWVQQERPEAVVEHLRRFFKGVIQD